MDESDNHNLGMNIGRKVGILRSSLIKKSSDLRIRTEYPHDDNDLLHSNKNNQGGMRTKQNNNSSLLKKSSSSSLITEDSSHSEDSNKIGNILISKLRDNFRSVKSIIVDGKTTPDEEGKLDDLFEYEMRRESSGIMQLRCKLVTKNNNNSNTTKKSLLKSFLGTVSETTNSDGRKQGIFRSSHIADLTISERQLRTEEHRAMRMADPGTYVSMLFVISKFFLFTLYALVTSSTTLPLFSLFPSIETTLHDKACMIVNDETAFRRLQEELRASKKISKLGQSAVLSDCIENSWRYYTYGRKRSM